MTELEIILATIVAAETILLTLIFFYRYLNLTVANWQTQLAHYIAKCANNRKAYHERHYQ